MACFSCLVADNNIHTADVALMHFFGALDTPNSLPNRANLHPRTDNRTERVCRTIGAFAVYMHDYGLDQFDSRFRDDIACWNVSAYNTSEPLLGNCSSITRNRHYTWWCNKRPNNPCVFNCPNQVSIKPEGGASCKPGAVLGAVVS